MTYQIVKTYNSQYVVRVKFWPFWLFGSRTVSRRFDTIKEAEDWLDLYLKSPVIVKEVKVK